MESKKTTSTGVSIVGVLQIVFLVLKLCKVINWSWLWVLSPLWIWACILALIFMLIGVCYYVKEKL